jgi:hypothetical protein
MSEAQLVEAVLRLRELGALRELARSPNARIDIGFDRNDPPRVDNEGAARLSERQPTRAVPRTPSLTGRPRSHSS